MIGDSEMTGDWMTILDVMSEIRRQRQLTNTSTILIINAINLNLDVKNEIKPKNQDLIKKSSKLNFN